MNEPQSSEPGIAEELESLFEGAADSLYFQPEIRVYAADPNSARRWKWSVTDEWGTQVVGSDALGQGPWSTAERAEKSARWIKKLFETAQIVHREPPR